MDARIIKLANLIEEQQKEQLRKDKLDCESNLFNCRTSIIEGNKYIKIDVGTSGKYMIDRDGNIYGIKAYGVIHKGHCYGTLDTIDDYYWGGYHAIKQAPKGNVR